MHFFRQTQFFAYVKSHKDTSKQSKTTTKTTYTQGASNRGKKSWKTTISLHRFCSGDAVGAQNWNNLNQTERSYMFGGREWGENYTWNRFLNFFFIYLHIIIHKN